LRRIFLFDDLYKRFDGSAEQFRRDGMSPHFDAIVLRYPVQVFRLTSCRLEQGLPVEIVDEEQLIVCCRDFRSPAAGMERDRGKKDQEQNYDCDTRRRMERPVPHRRAAAIQYPLFNASASCDTAMAYLLELFQAVMAWKLG
jgi:hypothetical protein